MGHNVLGRFRDALHRAKHHGSRRRKLTRTSVDQPIWQRLPDTIFCRILTFCDLQHIFSLLLTCRLLHHRIGRNESRIAQTWLHLRRNQSHYYIQDAEVENHIITPAFSSPGDDLTFISDLFPPPPPSYTDGTGTGSGTVDQPDYSFGYLADLTRCWKTCLRLSFRLAEYTVQHHLQNDPVARDAWGSSKTEHELAYTRGVEMLQARLLHPIAHLIFFLESTAAASDPDTTTSQPQQTSLQTQLSILSQPPFTNPHALLSAHHAMHLLASSARVLMTPEIPFPSTENWLGLLLMTSTLERVLELFVAAADDTVAAVTATPASSSKGKNTHEESMITTRARAASSSTTMGTSMNMNTNTNMNIPHKPAVSASASGSWTKRMEFLWRMREDWEEFLTSGPLSASPSVLNAGGGSGKLPTMEEVWFGAARGEICARGLGTHARNEGVVVLNGSVVKVGCEFCE